MTRTVGIAPGYLDKLDDKQRTFLLTAVGRKFYDEFLTKYGKHLFIFGTTGSGKTNKGYAFVDWTKHLESQIWFDSGKQGEILPLLCMDRKIRIIMPLGCNLIIEERVEGKWQPIKDHPEIVNVSTPYDALSSIAVGSRGKRHDRPERDTITIVSFRNSFQQKHLAIEWVAGFFESLATRCRDGTMPNIFPCRVHVDESQWAMAGKRVSGDGDRTKATEAIAENTMEARSAEIGIVLYAQGYTNIPPAIRENMLFNVICHGGMVTSDENGNLSKWCTDRGMTSPMKYLPEQGRFVFHDQGGSYPYAVPWKFRLYPKEESDRNWIKKLRVRYEGKYDQRSQESESESELFPELGRFQAMAIPPEKQDAIISRWQSEGAITNEEN